MSSRNSRRPYRPGTLADVPMRVTGQRGAYPMGGVMLYGPDNTRATKLVAVITKSPTAKPDPLYRWVTQAGDIREDAAIQAEVQAFLDRHQVRQVVRTERIIGCPHEEGTDYPLDSACPHCPFWQGRDRFTYEMMPSKAEQLLQAASFRAEPKVGRNDPCPCGSGKNIRCAAANNGRHRRSLRAQRKLFAGLLSVVGTARNMLSVDPSHRATVISFALGA